MPVKERIFPALICPGKRGLVDLNVDVLAAVAVIDETPMLKLGVRTTSAEKVLAAPTSAPFALPKTDNTSPIP